MTYNYDKLFAILETKNMIITDLVRAAGISTNAMAKLGKNEDVRLEILAKICEVLECSLNDIVEFKKDANEE